MEKGGQYRKNGLGMVCFVLCLVLGLYFLNTGLKFITLSFINDSLNNVIVIIGGILIIVGGFMFMRKSSNMQPMR